MGRPVGYQNLGSASLVVASACGFFRGFLLAFFDLTAKLADTTPNPLANVTDPGGAEKYDQDGQDYE